VTAQTGFGASLTISMMEIMILFGSSVLVFGPGLLAAVIAWNKGYRPWFWLLAMGPIGLLWILMTPGLLQAATPEERERWETRTDWSGGILSGLTMLPMFALPLIGMLVFMSLRAPMPMRAPMPTAPMPVPMSQQSESPESLSQSGSTGKA